MPNQPSTLESIIEGYRRLVEEQLNPPSATQTVTETVAPECLSSTNYIINEPPTTNRYWYESPSLYTQTARTYAEAPQAVPCRPMTASAVPTPDTPRHRTARLYDYNPFLPPDFDQPTCAQEEYEVYLDPMTLQPVLRVKPRITPNGNTICSEGSL